MKEGRETIQNKIRSAGELVGIRTDKEMAERLGIPGSTYRLYMKDPGRMRVCHLRAIEKLTGKQLLEG